MALASNIEIITAISPWLHYLVDSSFRFERKRKGKELQNIDNKRSCGLFTGAMSGFDCAIGGCAIMCKIFFNLQSSSCNQLQGVESSARALRCDKLRSQGRRPGLSTTEPAWLPTLLLLLVQALLSLLRLRRTA